MTDSSTSSSGPGHPMDNVALGSAGSTTFVLTPAIESIGSFSNAQNTQSIDNLTVPNMDTSEMVANLAPTPVLKPQTGGEEVPPLSLDNEQKPPSSINAQQDNITVPPRRILPVSNLVFQSPFAANEHLKFSSDTPMWGGTSRVSSSSAPSLWTAAPASSTDETSSDETNSDDSGESFSQVLLISDLSTQGPSPANANLGSSLDSSIPQLTRPPVHVEPLTPTPQPTAAPVLTNKRLKALTDASASQLTCVPGHVAPPVSATKVSVTTSAPCSMWPM